MNVATIALLLVIGSTKGQLNFEGNPLTENTEYTAMESRFSGKSVKEKTAENNVTGNVQQESLQTPSPSFSKTLNVSDHTNKPTVENLQKTIESNRQLSSNNYNQATIPVNRAEVALSSFLTSKTPEESRASLDYYLQSRESPENVQATLINQQRVTQQPVYNFPEESVSSSVNQHLTAQLMQQRQTLQGVPVNQQLYDPPVNMVNHRATVLNPLQQSYGIQARNDVMYPGWYQRLRRIRGRVSPYAQSRLGPGFFGAPPIPPVIPFKAKAPPVEVIYTKPPGIHRGPPIVSNPPVPYEDAGAWFPEADQPPPQTKDIFYSQLYSQSYDPHYYNYIAKTGKVKPYLYGKLGKYREEKDDGIWAELFRGFKKHGLKNMMNPTFLLGMSLPVITLMLTALVQKRSMSRSDARELSREDRIEEYLEQIQRAVECYEKKRRRRDTNQDDCWS